MTELIIGRESGVANPRLVIYQKDKPFYYGVPGSVPKGVSRKHCRVTIMGNSLISIEDITDNNFIFINGVECKKKLEVNLTDRIELGPSKYHLEISEILRLLFAKQSFNITHLKSIYDSFDKQRTEYQIKQGRLAVLTTLPMVFSMSSVALSFLFENQNVKNALYIAGVILLFAFFIIRMIKAEKTPLKIKKREEDFRDIYICPNPTCNHFLGNTPYKELIKNGSCPFCRAKYIEEW